MQYIAVQGSLTCGYIYLQMAPLGTAMWRRIDIPIPGNRLDRFAQGGVAVPNPGSKNVKVFSLLCRGVLFAYLCMYLAE